MSYDDKVLILATYAMGTSIPNRVLFCSLLVSGLAYFYSYTKKQLGGDAVFSVEQTVLDAWKGMVQKPSFQFQKIVVGINVNVDLIVSGASLLEKMNASVSSAGSDHKDLNNLQHVEESFHHFIQAGAPAERYVTDSKLFSTMVDVADKQMRHEAEYLIGGNAALMASKLVRSHLSRAQVLLVGPIGPRSKALLHPQVMVHNSTKIAKDEIHIIMEYKQGEIWGEAVAPASSRFIISHDLFSSSVVIDMFFLTISTFKPDLVIFSGMHLLQFQPKELWSEKLRVIKRNLGQINNLMPIHLELGSMSDKEYGRNVLHRVVPFVDSVGLNEQELSFLSLVGGGPYADQPASAGTMHVYKAVEILDWILNNYGRDMSDPNSKRVSYRLQRIHFHCLTFHLIVTKGPDWSNSQSAVAAGALLAPKQACGYSDVAAASELRTGDNFLVDKQLGRLYRFNPHQPVHSWMRGDTLFIFSPVLVCKHPVRTVGLGDAISATGLAYSQFYRFDK